MHPFYLFIYSSNICEALLCSEDKPCFWEAQSKMGLQKDSACVGEGLIRQPSISLEIIKTRVNPIRQVHTAHDKTVVDTLEKRAAW